MSTETSKTTPPAVTLTSKLLKTASTTKTKIIPFRTSTSHGISDIIGAVTTAMQELSSTLQPSTSSDTRLPSLQPCPPDFKCGNEGTGNPLPTTMPHYNPETGKLLTVPTNHRNAVRMEEPRTFLEQDTTVKGIYLGLPTLVTGQAFPITSSSFNSEILDAVTGSSSRSPLSTDLSPTQPLQNPSFVISALSLPYTVNGLADTPIDDDDFPEPENLVHVRMSVASLASYTSRYATNIVAVEPVADELSTKWLPKFSTIRSWCEDRNTEDAAESIKSYCGPTILSRRDVPPTMILSVDNQDTTLITKTISIITDTEMSVTSVDLPHSNSKTELYPTFSHPMPSPSSNTNADASKSTSNDNTTLTNKTSPNPLHRRSLSFADWGVTNDDKPPSTGTFILNLPPHRWDCVRRPRACQSLLSLIGVLCGMPFGVVVFFVIRYFWRKRQDKKNWKEDIISSYAEEGTKGLWGMPMGAMFGRGGEEQGGKKGRVGPGGHLKRSNTEL